MDITWASWTSRRARDESYHPETGHGFPCAASHTHRTRTAAGSITALSVHKAGQLQIPYSPFTLAPDGFAMIRTTLCRIHRILVILNTANPMRGNNGVSSHLYGDVGL